MEPLARWCFFKWSRQVCHPNSYQFMSKTAPIVRHELVTQVYSEELLGVASGMIALRASGDAMVSVRASFGCGSPNPLYTRQIRAHQPLTV